MGDLFNKTLNNDEAFYADAAMQYLSDLEEMKDKIEFCMQKYAESKEISKKLRDISEKLRGQNQSLKLSLEEKNLQIQELSNRLSNYEGNKKRVTLIDLVTKVNAFTKEIKVYTERYKKTGSFDNINEVINNVRKLFNMALIELNILNSENKEVAGILNTLASLEVNLINSLLILINYLVKIPSFV